MSMNADTLRGYQVEDDEELKKLWPGNNRRQLVEKLEHFRKLPDFLKAKKAHLESAIEAAEFDEEELNGAVQTQLQSIQSIRQTMASHAAIKTKNQRDSDMVDLKAFILECYQSADMAVVLKEVHEEVIQNSTSIEDRDWLQIVHAVDAIETNFGMFRENLERIAIEAAKRQINARFDQLDIWAQGQYDAAHRFIEEIGVQIETFSNDKALEISAKMALFDMCESKFAILTAQTNKKLFAEQTTMIKLQEVEPALERAKAQVETLTSNLEEARTQYQDAIAEKDQGVESHIQAMQKVTAEKDQALNNLEICQAAKAELEQSVKNIAETHSEIQARMTLERKEMIQNHDIALANLAEERDGAAAQLAEYLETNRKLEVALTSCREDQQNLRTKLEETHGTLTESQHALTLKTGQWEQAIGEKTALDITMSKLQTKCIEHEEALKTLEDAVTEAEKRSGLDDIIQSGLEEELESVKTSLKECVRKFDKKTQELTVQAEELNIIQSALTTRNEAFSTLQEQMKALDILSRAQRRKIRKVNVQRKHTCKKLADQTREMNAIRECLVVRGQVVQDLEIQRRDLVVLSGVLAAQIREAMNQRNLLFIHSTLNHRERVKAVDRSRSKDSIIQRMRNDLQTAQNAGRQTQALLTQTRTELATAASNLASNSILLNQTVIDRDQAQTERESARVERFQVRDQRNQARSERDQAYGDLTDVRKDLAHTRANLTQVREELSQAQEEIVRVRGDYVKAQEEATRQANKLQHDLIQVQDNLIQAREAMNNINDELIQAQEQLTATKENLKTESSNLKNALGREKEWAEKGQSMQTKLAGFEKAFSREQSLNNEVAKLTKELETFQSSNREIGEVKETAKVVTELEEALQAKESQLELLTSHHDILTHSNTSLEQRLCRLLNWSDVPALNDFCSKMHDDRPLAEQSLLLEEVFTHARSDENIEEFMTTLIQDLKANNSFSGRIMDALSSHLRDAVLITDETGICLLWIQGDRESLVIFHKEDIDHVFWGDRNKITLHLKPWIRFPAGMHSILLLAGRLANSVIVQNTVSKRRDRVR